MVTRRAGPTRVDLTVRRLDDGPLREGCPVTLPVEAQHRAPTRSRAGATRSSSSTTRLPFDRAAADLRLGFRQAVPDPRSVPTSGRRVTARLPGVVRSNWCTPVNDSEQAQPANRRAVDAHRLVEQGVHRQAGARPSSDRGRGRKRKPKPRQPFDSGVWSPSKAAHRYGGRTRHASRGAAKRLSSAPPSSTPVTLDERGSSSRASRISAPNVRPAPDDDAPKLWST